MIEVIPEITTGNGGEEEVKLTKKEHDEMVRLLAERKQNETNMQNELIDLRKKNRDLAAGSIQEPKSEEIQKVVEAELKKRDTEELKRTTESVLIKFLDSHPEFSTENDEGGLKFAAFQKALVRINTQGVKTASDYEQVLEDALRLTGQVAPATPSFSSTPRSAPEVRGVSKGAQLTTPEQKLVQNNFGGDVDAYLKVKAKRPEYIEELIRWVR